MCVEFPTLSSVTVTLIYMGIFFSVQNLCWLFKRAAVVLKLYM